MSQETTFASEVKSMTEDQCETEVIRCLTKIEEIEAERKEDGKLNAAKELIKDLGKAYSDAIKVEKRKIKQLMAHRQSIIDRFIAKVDGK